MRLSPELGHVCLESTNLMSTNSQLLSIKDLSISFGGLKALNKVSIEINKNEIIGLIGPNGAGKTTLFNALSGLAPVASGELEINGESHKWPKAHDLVDLGISRTLQGVGLFPELNCAQTIATCEIS